RSDLRPHEKKKTAGNGRLPRVKREKFLLAFLFWNGNISSGQCYWIKGEAQHKGAARIGDPQPELVTVSGFAVVDDPGYETMISDAVERRPAGWQRFVADNSHIAQRVAP